MLSSKTTKELLNNLKGRISKSMAISKTLSESEVMALKALYNTIDSIILWDKKLTKNKATRFKHVLKDYSDVLQPSKKEYIKKHIIPLIKKVTDQEWIENE